MFRWGNFERLFGSQCELVQRYDEEEEEYSLSNLLCEVGLQRFESRLFDISM